MAFLSLCLSAHKMRIMTTRPLLRGARDTACHYGGVPADRTPPHPSPAAGKEGLSEAGRGWGGQEAAPSPRAVCGRLYHWSVCPRCPQEGNGVWRRAEAGLGAPWNLVPLLPMRRKDKVGDLRCGMDNLTGTGGFGAASPHSQAWAQPLPPGCWPHPAACATHTCPTSLPAGC